jgi:hypothetical protein
MTSTNVIPVTRQYQQQWLWLERSPDGPRLLEAVQVVSGTALELVISQIPVTTWENVIQWVSIPGSDFLPD